MICDIYKLWLPENKQRRLCLQKLRQHYPPPIQSQSNSSEQIWENNDSRVCTIYHLLHRLCQYLGPVILFARIVYWVIKLSVPVHKVEIGLFENSNNQREIKDSRINGTSKCLERKREKKKATKKKQ